MKRTDDSVNDVGGTSAAAHPQQSNGPSSGPRRPQQQQQQQQPEEEMTPLERQRQHAIREAQQVMDSMGSNQLDHFNLLGVVANPRASQHGPHPGTPTTATMSSVHGPNSSHGGGGGDGGSSSFLFSDTYNTLESTISSLTEQIDALNHVFEDWSRQYLNDSHYQDANAPDAIPESQLTELPPELVHLDLSSLQVYLQQSGVLANTYQRHAQDQAIQKQKQQELQDRIANARLSAAAKSSSSSSVSTPQKKAPPSTPAAVPESPSATAPAVNDPNKPSPKDHLLEIPELFFQSGFDLTDPRTFRELLLNDGEDEVGDLTTKATPKKRGPTSSTATTTTASTALSRALEESTHDLFQIPPPDHFTGYLDKVEVALLEQVREKSEAFFQETNRFAQLKEWVGELLIDVQRIRALMEGQAKAIQSWQQVPEWDRKRKHLIRMESILDGSNEVLRCKQCIGGLLNAKDDLGAVEQIQYARRLLAGTVVEEEEEPEGAESAESATNAEDNNDKKNEVEAAAAEEGTSEQSLEQKRPQHVVEKEPPIELGRLQALRTVGEQLNQYESLVVTSLTEEVVEIFLEWNTSTLASMYGMSNGGVSTTTMSRAASQQEIRRRTLNIITSLRMCNALDHMVQFYNTRLHDMVRMTVRTTVGEFASDAAMSSKGGAATSVSVSVTAMSLERFIDCLDMLFEQLLALLTSASGVDEFTRKEGLSLKDESRSAVNGSSNNNNSSSNLGKSLSNHGGDAKENGVETHSSDDKITSESAIRAIVASAAELSSKSIAELLRLRKEVHSLVSLDEMRQIWDTCMKFVEEVEKLSGHKCTVLRSMLLTQAKAFVERKHDSNMTALAAALDSERWTQCEVSAERQMALTRLCTGRAGFSAGRRLVRGTSTDDGVTNSVKTPEAEVEGIRYKVVWSCLLLVEMVMTNIESGALFQSLASNVVGKVSELLRLFNSRSTQLVLGAGAIHSAARLKSINAKHLSLVTQCLGMTIAILPHIRAALMAQLPQKQYTLLTDLDKIKKEYADHNEKVLNKFVTIIGGIVEHGLAKHIGGTDFDARARSTRPGSQTGVLCCVFLEGVVTNTKKMHQVLSALLPPEHLQDVFSRIFAFIDQKIPALLISASNNKAAPSNAGKPPPPFRFPKTDDGKKRLLDEVESVTSNLNSLEGVFPWEFSAVSVLAKTLEYELPGQQDPSEPNPVSDNNGDTTSDENGEPIGEAVQQKENAGEPESNISKSEDEVAATGKENVEAR